MEVIALRDSVEMVNEPHVRCRLIKAGQVGYNDRDEALVHKGR